MPYCAIPPIDMSVGHVGRGYGLGFNRLHTRADQLHGGQDYMVAAGTPIVAPIPGRVVLVSTNDGPGYNRGMRGYGNSVVLEHRFALPVPTSPLPGARAAPTRGLPNPFWTSFNHMREAPRVRVGDQVRIGDVLGYVGNTTNGQFSGMPNHLHVEVRKTAFPSSYDRDTIDPNLLWASLGIDLIGSHREAERQVGGTLRVRAGGPSDCRPGQTTSLAGYLALFGDATGGTHSAGESYVDPATLAARYPAGTAPPTTPDVDPPDYAPASSGGGALIVGAAAVGLLAWWMTR